MEFTSGDAPNVLSFAGMDGLTGSIGTGGEAVTYGWNALTNTLTATSLRGAVFSVQITDINTGDYKVTLLKNVLHGLGPNEENALDPTVALTYTIVDNDGSDAEGTLTITFDDDAPTAINDADAVGAPGATATGNVITDLAAGDAGDSDTGADSKGTDGATVSGLVSINVAANPDTDLGANFAVAGQYGTLTMTTTGDYVYTQQADTPGGAIDRFTYTLKDGDGDTDTAVLEIVLGNSFPAAGTVNVLLDDDVVAGANGLLDGPGDDNPDVAAAIGGTLAGSGGDAPLSYALTASVVEGGGGSGFTYVFEPAPPAGQQVLYIKQGGATVITVSLTTASGVYTVVHNAAIAHATLNGVDGDKHREQPDIRDHLHGHRFGHRPGSACGHAQHRCR